jgi:hypothetical protein
VIRAGDGRMPGGFGGGVFPSDGGAGRFRAALLGRSRRMAAPPRARPREAAAPGVAGPGHGRGGAGPVGTTAGRQRPCAGPQAGKESSRLGDGARCRRAAVRQRHTWFALALATRRWAASGCGPAALGWRLSGRFDAAQLGLVMVAQAGANAHRPGAVSLAHPTHLVAGVALGAEAIDDALRRSGRALPRRLRGGGVRARLPLGPLPATFIAPTTDHLAVPARL